MELGVVEKETPRYIDTHREAVEESRTAMRLDAYSEFDFNK